MTCEGEHGFLCTSKDRESRKNTRIVFGPPRASGKPGVEPRDFGFWTGFSPPIPLVRIKWFCVDGIFLLPALAVPGLFAPGEAHPATDPSSATNTYVGTGYPWRDSYANCRALTRVGRLSCLIRCHSSISSRVIIPLAFWGCVFDRN